MLEISATFQLGRMEDADGEDPKRRIDVGRREVNTSLDSQKEVKHSKRNPIEIRQNQLAVIETILEMLQLCFLTQKQQLRPHMSLV